MTTTTEFQLVDINKLVPYANNARTHNKEQILKLQRLKTFQKSHVYLLTI